MEAVAAAVGQAPVMRDFRRNVAGTVIILTLGTMLIAGGADWSCGGIRSWAHNKVNTNISFPMTNWQLEVRIRWVKPVIPSAAATVGPATIYEYFDTYPLRTKLYSVGLMCSPRWALMWAWLFDRDTGLKLLHQHIEQNQATLLYYSKRIAQFLLPDLLPLTATEAAADTTPPLVKLLQGILQLNSTLLFWIGWLLFPGLHSAYYALFFASQSPIKAMYGVMMGLGRTAVELRALYKCTQAAMQQNKQLVRNSLLCCYALPFIMTLQSMSVLLMIGLVFPLWMLHICVVAFCLWGPPAMIALMTTAWQPDRHRPLLADAPMGLGEGAVAAAGGAVVAMAALVAQNHHRAPTAGGNKPTRDGVYWPKPVEVPEDVEEHCPIPHYFICSITHSIMLEPAVTATGATYERTAILEWLKTQKRDPLTGRELRPDQVSPNLALYRAIEEWVHSSKEQLKKHKHQKHHHHHQQQQQDQHSHHDHRHSTNCEKGDRSDRQKSERGAKGASVGSRRVSIDAHAISGSSSNAAADAQRHWADQQ